MNACCPVQLRGAARRWDGRSPIASANHSLGSGGGVDVACQPAFVAA